MKTRLIIGLLTAGLASTIATTASADYGHRHGRSDHGSNTRYVDRHNHNHYVVKFDLHGSRKLHADSHWQAHALVNELERYGAHAHIDGRQTVHYHMDGDGRRSFHSHREAHRFEDRLRSLGFHVRLIHD
ncbi:MAG TPA: hypothetical protein VEA69_14625 [Tepidisphaeraceae bacterium]|nr:hypothetical protein [Tepidisphaeraceae bacterium]